MYYSSLYKFMTEICINLMNIQRCAKNEFCLLAFGILDIVNILRGTNSFCCSILIVS